MPRKKTDVEEPKVDVNNAATRDKEAPTEAPPTEGTTGRQLREGAVYYARRNFFLGDYKYMKGEKIDGDVIAENQDDCTRLLQNRILSEEPPE